MIRLRLLLAAWVVSGIELERVRAESVGLQRLVRAARVFQRESRLYIGGES